MITSRRVLYLVPVLALLVAYVATLPNRVTADEVLQLAPAGYPTMSQSADAIFSRVRKLSDGQTGMPMILSTAVLEKGGASYLALRLPSYLAYAACLVAGFFYLTELGVSLAVCLWFAILFGLSQLNLQLGWEATPFVLFEGCVLAFLWSWRRFATGRAGGLPMVFLAAAAGILCHPFFVAYAALIVLCGLAFVHEERAGLLGRLRRPRDGVPALLAAFLCGCLFVLVGKLSWFGTQSRDFGLDPYEFVKHDQLLPQVMVSVFFYPVSIVVAPALALGTILLLRWRGRTGIAPLVGPFFSLVINVMLTQTALALLVIQAQYWLMPRQWIAGNALSFLAAALLVELVVRLLGIGRTLLDGLSFMTAVTAAILLGIGIHANLAVPVEPATQGFRATFAAQKEPTGLDWQKLAHQNLLEGGPVWPELTRYFDGAK